MSNYTIVEPHFEFIEPPTSENYLEFLEECTRVCYKSEDRIKPGSAEKLMSKEYEHYSVTEHANCIIAYEPSHSVDIYWSLIARGNPLLRISFQDPELIISGNIRMWLDFFKQQDSQPGGKADYLNEMKQQFSEKFPFFAVECDAVGYLQQKVRFLDENPLSNRSSLTPKQMKTTF